MIFQLSIFTLCTAATGGNIDTCSKSHAVQALNFRNFVWDVLTNSNLSSLLKGLNLQKSNLNVAGKLTQREGQWSPFVTAILALTALVILIVSASPYSNTRKLVLLSIASGFVLFTFIPVVVVTAVLLRVKSATSDDNFGVITKDGRANLALAWTSFTLAILSLQIIAFSRIEKGSVLDDEYTEKKAAVELEPAARINEIYDGPTPVLDHESNDQASHQQWERSYFSMP